MRISTAQARLGLFAILMSFISFSAFSQVIPPNDDCADAIKLVIGDVDFGTTINASADVAPACNGVSVQAPGVWYKVTGNGDFITAEMCSFGATYDARISVYTGTCGALVCEVADDNGCGVDDPTVTWLSQPCVTYYILVHGTNGETGDFIMTLSSPTLSTIASATVSDDEICADETTTLDGSASSTDPAFAPVTYSWAPTTGLSNPTAAVTTFDPALAAGTYVFTLTVTDQQGCTDQTTVTVLVNPLPVVSFSGLQPEYCVDDLPTTIVGSPAGGTLYGNGVQYTAVDTVITFDTTYVSKTMTSGYVFNINSGFSASPVNIYYEGLRMAQIYTPAELTAMGFTAGDSITSLGWLIFASPNFTPLPGYTIEMRNTTTFTASTIVNAAGWTTVKNPFNYTPTPGFVGIPALDNYDNITFDQGFVWDGTSNLAIKVCFGPAPNWNSSGQVLIYSAPFTTSQSYYSRRDGFNLCDPSVTAFSNGNTFRYAFQAGATNQVITPDTTYVPIVGLADIGQFNPAVAGVGTHTVYYTYTDANGCTNIDSQTTVVHPLPVVSVSGLAPEYCVDDAPATITGSPLGATGSFVGAGVTDNGDGTASFSPTTAGVGPHTITFTYTDPVTGCVNSTTVSTVVNPLPVVSFTGLSADPYCVSDGVVALTGNPLGGTFSGAGVTNLGGGLGEFDPLSIGLPGDYTVYYSFTDGNGCTNVDSQTVTLISTGNDLCENAILVNVGDVVSGTTECSTIDAAPFCVVPIGAPGVWYTIQGTGGTITADLCNIPGTTFDTRINVYSGDCSALVCVAGNDDGPACGFGYPSTVTWNSSPCETYYILVQGFNGLTGDFVMDITGSIGTLAANAGADQTICEDATATLGGAPTATGGNPGYTYSWTPAADLNNAAAANPVFTPAAAGTYTLNVLVTDNTGCQISDEVVVTVNALPALAINGLAASYCIDDDIAVITGTPNGGTFTGTGLQSIAYGGNSYSFPLLATPQFIPDNDPAGFSISQTITTPYTALGTDVTLESITVVIDHNDIGDLYIEVENPAGTIVTLLNQPLNGTGSCTADDLNANFVAGTANPADAVCVFFIPSIVGNVNASTGNDVNDLNDGSSPNGAWEFTVRDLQSGITGTVLSVSLNFSGQGVAFNPGLAGIGTHTITYSYTDGNGCSNSIAQQVTVNPLPVVSFAGLDNFYCFNDAPISLVGNPAGGSFSGTGVEAISNNPAGCSYTLNLFDSFGDGWNGAFLSVFVGGNFVGNFGMTSGSFASYTFAVSDGALIEIFFTGGFWDSEVSFTLLNTNGAAEFSQGPNPPDGLLYAGASTSVGCSFDYFFNPAIAGAGTHTVFYTYTDGNGCTNVDSLSTTVNPEMIVNAGPDATICANDTIELGSNPTGAGGTGALTYAWTPSTGLSSTTVANPQFVPALVAGVYNFNVTVTDAVGCTESDAITITVDTIPTVILSGLQPFYCVNSECDSLSGFPEGGTFAGPGVISSGPPAPVVTCSPGSLSTILGSNNSGSVGGAVYFDLNNTSGGDINITALGMHITAATTVNIYAKPGSYLGSVTNPGAWTLIGTATAASGGLNILSTATVNGTVTLGPGQWGIALHTPTASNRYTNGNGANQNYSNADISLSLGQASNTLWGSPFSPRVWNGRIDYEVCTTNAQPDNVCDYTVTVGGTGFLDEVSWTLRDNTNAVIASGGPYAFGSTNTVTVSSGNPPLTFFIETQGTFNDNVANYSVESNGQILVSGVITGGQTFTSGPLTSTCGAGGGGGATFTCSDVVFNNTGLPTALPPTGTSGTLIRTQTVSGLGTSIGTVQGTDVLLKGVEFSINHTWNSDLDVFMTAPGGTELELWTDIGGSSDGFNVTVSDNGTLPWPTSGFPITGTYRTESGTLMNTFWGGLNPNGTWTLRIVDDAGGDLGTLNAWNLVFEQCVPDNTGLGTYFCPDSAGVGTHIITYSWTGDNGCTTIDSFEVTVFDLPTITVEPDTMVCRGEPVQLTATASGTPGPYSYMWAPDTFLNTNMGPVVIATPDSTTIYTIAATDGNGCTNTVEHELTINQLPDLTLEIYSGVDSACFGDVLCFNVGVGGYIIGARLPELIYYKFDQSGSNSVLNEASAPVGTASGALVGALQQTGQGLSGSMLQGVGGSSATNFVNTGWATDLSGSWTIGFWLSNAPNNFTTQWTVMGDATAGVTATVSSPQGFGTPRQMAFNIAGTAPVNITGFNNAGNFFHAVYDSAANELRGYLNGDLVATEPLISYNDFTSAGPFKVGGAGTLAGLSNGMKLDEFRLYNRALNDQEVALTANYANLSNDPSGLTFNWITSGNTISNTGAYGDSICVDASTTGWIIVEVTDSFGCFNVDSLFIYVNPEIVVDAGVDTNLCQGSSLVLGGNPTAIGGTGNLTYVWEPSLRLNDNTLANPTTNTLLTTNYTVSVTDDFGCTVTDEALIVSRELPKADAGNDVTICINESIMIGGMPAATGGTGPYTYEWTPATGLDDATAANPTANPTTTTSYTLLVTDKFGCQDDSFMTVQVYPLPIVTIDPVAALCANDAPVTLTAATMGGTWSGAGIVDPANGIFDPAVAGAGAHEVVYTNTSFFGCVDSDTITVTVNPVPVVDITSPAGFCFDQGVVQLTANVAGGTWSGNGIVDPSGLFDPAVAGLGSHMISLEFTDANGCTGSDMMMVTVEMAPDAGIQPVSELCSSDAPITLTANTAGGTWSGTGITDPAAGTFNPAVAGAGVHTITYTVTGPSGCVATATIDITVNGLTGFAINAAGPFCVDGSNVILSATFAGGYWSGNGVVNPLIGEFSPMVAGPGIHTVVYTITNADGCISIDSTQVVVNASPNATIAAAGPFCANNAPAILTAATAGGSWSGPGITNATTGTFDPATAGPGTHTITYEVTDANGCFGSATAVIKVNELPVISGSVTNVLCPGDANGKIDVTVEGGAPPYDFSWSNGANTIDIDMIAAGTYTLTVTDSKGCTETATFTVGTSSTPITANAIITNATAPVYNNGAIDITPSGGTQPYFYEWSNGANTQDISGLRPDTFRVTITDANGCSYDFFFEVKADFGLAVDLSDLSKNISLYPNPTSDKININIELNGLTDNLEMTVFDVLGRKVYERADVISNVYTHTIGMETWASGQYMIRFKIGEEFVTKKFVLTR